MFFRHTHNDEPVAVQHVTMQPFGPRKTLVLWRCKCGSVNTTELLGEWSLSQIRGESEADGADQLRRDPLPA